MLLQLGFRRHTRSFPPNCCSAAVICCCEAPTDHTTSPLKITTFAWLGLHLHHTAPASSATSQQNKQNCTLHSLLWGVGQSSFNFSRHAICVGLEAQEERSTQTSQTCSLGIAAKRHECIAVLIVGFHVVGRHTKILHMLLWSRRFALSWWNHKSNWSLKTETNSKQDAKWKVVEDSLTFHNLWSHRFALSCWNHNNNWSLET